MQDTSPQLGGDLDVNGNDIVSTSNGNIDILPNGTGVVNLDGDGSSGGVSISDGLVDIRTGTGTRSQVNSIVSLVTPTHKLFNHNLTLLV